MSSPSFNPFPGLRPFAMDERHLFFGREQQVADILVRLRTHHFLAVVGASGSGKSSLIRAGLLPELYGGTMRAAGSSWRVVVLRPGADPTTRLAHALCESDLHGPDAGEELPLRVRVTLERSGLGLVEAVRQAALPPRTNVLIVVDQFEELFRYARNATVGLSGATAFVRLLLDASRQTEVPVYVVLTMRSDFLGECSQYAGLAEAINQSEYLVPRLNREQWRCAIEGPVRVGGGAIAPRLVQRLLNDVGEDPDQLPLLQHALMRTWDHWTQHARDHEPLDLDHYEAVGGIGEALSRHADETYALLPGQREQAVAAQVFKALTERAADARGTRRPTPLADLIEITGAEPGEVLTVTELFRQEGRAFLMPPPETALEPDTVIDIAHESLMRTWERLNGWTEEEASSVRIYGRLAESALLWKENKAGLFGEPDLGIARRWRAGNRPNAAWARRYGPGFDVALEFLDASTRAREEEVAAEEAGRQRELEQARARAENERLRAQIRVREAHRRVWLVIALAVFALALAASLLAYRNARMARSHRLAAASSAALPSDPELALLLATNAWHLHPSPEATTLIRKSLAAWPLHLEITNHASKVVRVRFSPNGTSFATADDAGQLTLTSTAGTNPVWQRDGVTVRTLRPAHDGTLAALEFSRNSQFLVSAAGGQARVWSVLTGDTLQELPLHAGRVISAGFSPDGLRILTVADNGAVLIWEWSAQPGPTVQTLPVPAGRPRLAACSPQGQWYAVASDPSSSPLDLGANTYLIERWRTDGTEPRLLAGQHGDVRSLAFSADDRLLAAIGREGMVRVWDSASGRLLASSAKPTPSAPVGLVFQGGLLLAFDTRVAQVFATNDLGAAAQTTDLDPLRELTQPQGILAASLSPDGTMLLTAGMDSKARLQLLTGESISDFIGHTRQIDAVDFSPDARWILTGSDDGRARLWENRAGRFLAPPLEPPAKLVAVAPEGTRVIGSEVSIETPLVILPPPLEGGWHAPASAAIYRPVKQVQEAASSLTEDGRFLAVGEGTNVVVIDTRSTPLRPIWTQPQPGEVRCLAFGPGEGAQRLAVGIENGGVRVWDFDPRRPARTVWRDLEPSMTNVLERVGFSPGARRLFGLDYSDWITVWDLAGGSRVGAFRQRGAGCAAFDPEGRFLAVGCDSGATWIWLIDPSHPVDRQSQHRGKINHLAWRRDGLFLVTGGGDKTAIVWEVGDLTKAGGLSPVASLGGHPAPLIHVGFGDGDQSVLTADLRGGLRRHQLEDVLAPRPRQLVDVAARRLTRGFDAEEKRMYLKLP